MAIEWMENFQNYGASSTALSNMADGMWAQVASISYADVVADPDGVSSGKVFQVKDTAPASPSSGTTAGDVIRRVLPSGTQTTVGVLQRWWFDELPSISDRLPRVSFRDSGNGAQIEVAVDTTGTISVYRGSLSPLQSETLLGTSSTPVITAAGWNHVEIKVVFDNSTSGSVEVRVNGVPEISLTGIDTQATATAGCAQIVWGHMNALSTNWNWWIKDIVVWNSTGTYNNDFMGDCQVVSLYPESDVSLNWTPSTGSTGYDLIDEIVPDDADYISAGDPPPAAYVCELTDLDPDIVTVKGLQPVQRSLKTDGGTANVQLSMRSSGSDDAGTDQAITVTATYWFDISEEDPNTSSSWTPASVDAAQLVIDRTV